MEIWFCFPVTEVERSVGAAPGAAAGAAAGGSRGLSPSPAPSSPSTPVTATSPSASTSSASSSPSPSSSASVLVAGLDKSVLQVSSPFSLNTYTRAWSWATALRIARRARTRTYAGERILFNPLFFFSRAVAHVSLKYLFLCIFRVDARCRVYIVTVRLICKNRSLRFICLIFFFPFELWKHNSTRNWCYRAFKDVGSWAGIDCNYWPVNLGRHDRVDIDSIIPALPRKGWKYSQRRERDNAILALDSIYFLRQIEMCCLGCAARPLWKIWRRAQMCETCARCKILCRFLALPRMAELWHSGRACPRASRLIKVHKLRERRERLTREYGNGTRARSWTWQ